MRKKILLFLSTILFMISPLFITNVLGDQPPDPGGDPTGGTPVGGSPIGSGLVVLTSLGIAYGVKKVFKYNRNEKNS